MPEPLIASLARRFPRLYYVAPAAAWAAAIMLASHQPSDAYPEVSVPFADKAAHGVAYGLLGVLVARAWARGRPMSWRQAAGAAAAAALFGITDEVHQFFIPGRSAEFADWVWDCIGAVGGAALWKAGAGRGGREKSSGA